MNNKYFTYIIACWEIEIKEKESEEGQEEWYLSNSYKITILLVTNFCCYTIPLAF